MSSATHHVTIYVTKDMNIKSTFVSLHLVDDESSSSPSWSIGPSLSISRFWSRVDIHDDRYASGSRRRAWLQADSFVTTRLCATLVLLLIRTCFSKDNPRRFLLWFHVDPTVWNYSYNVPDPLEAPLWPSVRAHCIVRL